jgi:uncharacterized alkaline shock family protein YloU
MKGQVTTESGSVSIDKNVITRYAGLSAIECFGIVGMAAVNVKDGLSHLLKRSSLTRGIDLTIREGKLYFDFHVIVSYGVSIAVVADNLMHTVKYKIEKFTGMSVGAVNVYVDGVLVID